MDQFKKSVLVNLINSISKRKIIEQYSFETAKKYLADFGYIVEKTPEFMSLMKEVHSEFNQKRKNPEELLEYLNDYDLNKHLPEKEELSMIPEQVVETS